MARSTHTKVSFHLPPQYIEADGRRTYEEIVLYNNYDWFKKMDHVRFHHLLSPILTTPHREKMLHYRHTSCNPSTNSST